jgi:GTP cyclohydrolase II
MRHRKNGNRARIVARAKLPTRFGSFTIFGAESKSSAESAVVLLHGKVRRGQAPLVRIHSQCLTGDVFHSQRCDCRAQLELALRMTARASCGMVLYLPQEGRGIGLMNKLKAYELQDRGRDTVEANRELGFAADDRDYAFCAEVLKRLGAHAIRLMSNNPDKVRQLERSGIRILERVPCQPRTSHRTRSYLLTKKNKLGHILEF